MDLHEGTKSEVVDGSAHPVTGTSRIRVTVREVTRTPQGSFPALAHQAKKQDFAWPLAQGRVKLDGIPPAIRETAIEGHGPRRALSSAVNPSLQSDLDGTALNYRAQGYVYVRYETASASSDLLSGFRSNRQATMKSGLLLIAHQRA